MLCCIDFSTSIIPFPGNSRKSSYEVQSPPPLVATPGNAFMSYDDYQKQNPEYEMVGGKFSISEPSYENKYYI